MNIKELIEELKKYPDDCEIAIMWDEEWNIRYTNIEASYMTPEIILSEDWYTQEDVDCILDKRKQILTIRPNDGWERM